MIDGYGYFMNIGLEKISVLFLCIIRLFVLIRLGSVLYLFEKFFSVFSECCIVLF